MKISMRKIQQGDRVLLNNGETVTVKEIKRPSICKTDYYVRYDEYPNISLKYNSYGNVLGRFNEYSIKEVVREKEPEVVLGDYICFDIPTKRLGNPAYRRLVTDCFGILEKELPCIRFCVNHGLNNKETIICSPQQFSTFIMYRNMRGIDNLIKELNARPVEVFTFKANLYFTAENV